MKIGSLFTGYGGLDMAAEAAFGATTAWVSDIDKGACKILAHRYPDVPNLSDITTIDWSQVEPVDIITGGSPCQDLSSAGKRAGMTDGTRSNLWVAMREAIAQLQPTYVIWENVRGAFSAKADSALEHCSGCVGDGSTTHLRALGRVLGDLSDLGYDTQWRGLRAADVGAPHNRFRVFVLAWRRDGAAVPDADALRLQRSRGPRVGRAGPADDGGGAVTLLPTPRATRGGSNTETQALLPTPMVGSTNPAAHGQISGDCRAKMAEALDRWGDYAAAIQRWEYVIGRPAPEPTQVSTKGNPQLSARFTEWLMGIPAGWITDVPGVTRNEALKMCGNGVVPQQAYAAITDALAFFEIGAAA